MWGGAREEEEEERGRMLALEAKFLAYISISAEADYGKK